MGKEGFDNKGLEGTIDRLDLDGVFTLVTRGQKKWVRGSWDQQGRNETRCTRQRPASTRPICVQIVPGCQAIEHCLAGALTRGTRTHLDLLTGALLDPLLCGVPFLVEKEETTLSTTLDELIGFCDELGGVHPLGKLGVGRNRVRLWIPGDLGDLGGGVNETRRDGSMFCDRWGTLEPVRKQELRVVLVDGWKE